MDTKPVKAEDEYCTGKCAHSKDFHVVKFDGKLACAKVDCACMEFVPKRPN